MSSGQISECKVHRLWSFKFDEARRGAARHSSKGNVATMEEDLVVGLRQDSENVASPMPIDVSLCPEDVSGTMVEVGLIYPFKDSALAIMGARVGLGNGKPISLT